MASTLVFDFDGTVAVGNGPVLAYAREIARFADPGFAARAEAEIEAFEAGRASGYRDGYDVVGSLADAAGVAPDDRQGAYLASRGALGTPGGEPVAAAPGLAEILAALPADAHVVLATNAPEAGVERALTAWGIRGFFDEIVFDTGKPAGLAPIVERALARGPVLSIGDIVANDLEPATALGADTALVGATAAASPAAVTMRGTTLAELTAPILGWARSHSSSDHQHDTAPTL
ncbi:HAD family hydrolase [Microbacterium halophytorum]|uniref:HAD family hydrolase n=1 Tax=Microbacterium halophytorum TaxID=2067568 RepID=UPI000CFD3F9D|nr:HAD family hydrolase [Microbacterium halophytorum]